MKHQKQECHQHDQRLQVYNCLLPTYVCMCVSVCQSAGIECLQFRNLACASAVFGFHGSNANLLLSQTQISQVSPHLMEDIELTEGNALFMTCIHKIVKK